MAVKRYNPTTGNWEIFPGTAGEDAYMMAQTNGYTGTKDEYIESLVNIPIVVNKLSNIDNTATKGSSNLINSNAVWKVEDDLRKLIPSNVALPERVYEVYQNGQVVGSGKLITEWNSPIATIDPYSINTLTDTWILSLQQILQ